VIEVPFSKIPIGMIFQLKGGGNQKYERIAVKDLRSLFPNTPIRSLVNARKHPQRLFGARERDFLYLNPLQPVLVPVVESAGLSGEEAQIVKQTVHNLYAYAQHLELTLLQEHYATNRLMVAEQGAQLMVLISGVNAILTKENR